MNPPLGDENRWHDRAVGESHGDGRKHSCRYAGRCPNPRWDPILHGPRDPGGVISELVGPAVRHLAVLLDVAVGQPGQRFHGRRTAGADRVEAAGGTGVVVAILDRHLPAERGPHLVEWLLDDVSDDLARGEAG